MHPLFSRPLIAGLSVIAARLGSKVYDLVADRFTDDTKKLPNDKARVRLTERETEYLVEYIECNFPARKDWSEITEHLNTMFGRELTGTSYRSRYRTALKAQQEK